MRPALGCVLAALALAMPNSATAQVTASETAEAHATIVREGTIIKLTDMDFGQIVKPLAAGTVVLTPSPTASCMVTGGLVHTGACQAASYRGDLTWLYILRITKPAGNQINLVGPAGATMRLNNFTFGGTTGLTFQFGTSTYQYYLVSNSQGVFTFHVGGTLNVAANQRPGVYEGTFDLQFNYD